MPMGRGLSLVMSVVMFVMFLVKKQAIFLQNRRIFRIFADVLSTKIVSTKKLKTKFYGRKKTEFSGCPIGVSTVF